MAKRFTASKSQLVPDPRFGLTLVSKFVNCLMHDGKKSVALRVFYDAMEIIEKKVPDVEPSEVFTQAVENVKPHRGSLEASRWCDVSGSDSGWQSPSVGTLDPVDSGCGSWSQGASDCRIAG